MGSVGDSYDNALAETINGLYMAEVIWRQRPWPSVSAVEMATPRWVDWLFNRFVQVKSIRQHAMRHGASVPWTPQ